LISFSLIQSNAVSEEIHHQGPITAIFFVANRSLYHELAAIQGLWVSSIVTVQIGYLLLHSGMSRMQAILS